VNGFLVPPGDPTSLAEKMISAWTDTGLAVMAEAAKQRMQEFAPEKTVASLLSYYSEVLHANGFNRHQNQKPTPQ
jgi:glycosyltransferase involved in cell wall biosynthesis